MSGHLRVHLEQSRPWTYMNEEMRWEGILCSLIEYVSKSLNFTYSLNDQIYGSNISIFSELFIENNVMYF